MKLAALLLFALAGQSTPEGPAVAPRPDFPLHVQVLMTKARANRYTSQGFGRGNLVGSPDKGIDFTYECSVAFLNTNSREFYQARWKKQDRQLEILLQRIGSDHLDKCQLDIAYKDAPYRLQ